MKRRLKGTARKIHTIGLI
uniref:Uncharacterized protein n=1 Tax=Arundo donax TaxID=35708 RepID=A0A0A9B317_ARUDO